MTSRDDWRRAATTEQMSDLTRTIDPTVAHIARIQDYWLGGKDHFEADRIAGDEAIAQLPDMARYRPPPDGARAGRRTRQASRRCGAAWPASLTSRHVSRMPPCG